MIRVLLVILASLLVLAVSGCANRVAAPVQQHYLVVSATMAGPVDIANFRYFVFLKYNASSTAGPNLLSPSQQNHVLSLPGASTSAGAVDNVPVGGSLGYITGTCPFDFDEFHEDSNYGKNSGTSTALFSVPNSALVVTINTNTIQFSIPLNTASSPLGSYIGINIVAANNATNTNLIQDYLVSNTNTTGYQLFLNTIGNTTNTISAPINPTPAPSSPSADIISWSASII